MNGDFLASRRVNLGLSQTQVAAKLGYTAQTISLWEKGKGFPNLPCWCALASLYQLDLEGLLFGKAKKESNICDESSFDGERFATHLKKLRKKASLTQAEVAKRIGVPSNAVIRFEQGVSFPTQEQFIALTELFGVTIDELYFCLNGDHSSQDDNHRHRWVLPLSIGLSFCLVLGLVFGIASIVLNKRDNHDGHLETISFDASSISPPTSSGDSVPTSESTETTLALYTIDFDLDGGSSSSYSGPIQVNEGEGSFLFYDVIKEGHIFRGWMVSNELVFDENGNQINEIPWSDNLIFKAKWEEETYPIYYILDGGTNHEDNPDCIGYNETIILKNPAKTGYLFIGWYADETREESVDQISGKNIKTKGSITVYASFSYNKKDPNNYPYLSFSIVSTSRKEASVKGVFSSFEGGELSIPSVITIDDEDYNVTQIQDYAFQGFTSVTSIVYPKMMNHIGNYAFSGCTSLAFTRVLTSSSDGLSIGQYAYSGCTSLQFVMLSEYVDSCGANLFLNCHLDLMIMLEGAYNESLGNAWNPNNRPIIPYAESLSIATVSGVKYAPISIQGHAGYFVAGALTNTPIISESIYGRPVFGLAVNAFYGSSITTIGLNENLLAIMDYAFAYCTSLNSIFIPASVEEIGHNAFYQASALTIHAAASSKPSGWALDWNPSSLPVIWGASN